jgi:hypothetical protein
LQQQEVSMRSLLLTLSIVVAGLATVGRSANAQNYPWCAYYGGGDMGGGGSNCGFTTFEQCMTTLSGMGGFCDRNTQYVPPAGPRPAPGPHHHTHRLHP